MFTPYILSFMLDHSCGYCSLLPNLKKGFGWNPGKKMNHWFGEQLRERTGDCDITFKEVRKSLAMLLPYISCDVKDRHFIVSDNNIAIANILLHVYLCLSFTLSITSSI